MLGGPKRWRRRSAPGSPIDNSDISLHHMPQHRQPLGQQFHGGIDQVAPQLSRFCQKAGDVRAVDDQITVPTGGGAEAFVDAAGIAAVAVETLGDPESAFARA
jgi:hypothetical protein